MVMSRGERSSSEKLAFSPVSILIASLTLCVGFRCWTSRPSSLMHPTKRRS